MFNGLPHGMNAVEMWFPPTFDVSHRSLWNQEIILNSHNINIRERDVKLDVIISDEMSCYNTFL